MKEGKIVFQGKTKKGNQILIRYLVKDDVEMIRDYMNTLSKEQTFIRFQGEQILLEEEKKYVTSQLEKIVNNQVVKLLAFCKNKLIGICDIVMCDKVENHIGSIGLTIAKDYRNEGVGKLLMRLVLDEAEKNIPQLKIAKLSVFANNPIAKALYEKMGFIEYGKLPKGIKHKNEYVDEIMLYKNV